MKHEPVDYLGRPRRTRGNPILLVLVQILLGLIAGAGAGVVGLVWAQSFHEPWFVTVPPLGVLVALSLMLLVLERAGHHTGYLVIICSLVAGLAGSLFAYSMGLAQFFTP